MRPPKQFFVYIMTNGLKPAVLYAGITGNLTSPRLAIDESVLG